MAVKKRKTAVKRNKTAPAIQKVSINQWLSAIKSCHISALEAKATPSGCCQVQNQMTGGVFQIPTDAATCQAIGGVFTPGPC